MTDEDEQHSGDQDEGKTDREEGGPTAPAESTETSGEGAKGTKPTPGFDAHQE